MFFHLKGFHWETKSFSTKIKTKQGGPLYLSFQHHTNSSEENKTRKGNNRYTDWERKNKVFPHSRYDCLCRNIQKNQLNLLELISDYSKVSGYKVNIKKYISLLAITNKQVEFEVTNTNTLVPQNETFKYKFNKICTNQNEENNKTLIFHGHGSKDSILSRCQFLPTSIYGFNTIPIKESTAPQPIPRLEPVYRPRTPWIERRLGPLQERPQHTLPKIYCINRSSSLPQIDLQPLARVLWESENNQTFIGLLGTSSELHLYQETVVLQSEYEPLEVRWPMEFSLRSFPQCVQWDPMPILWLFPCSRK